MKQSQGHTGSSSIERSVWALQDPGSTCVEKLFDWFLGASEKIFKWFVFFYNTPHLFSFFFCLEGKTGEENVGSPS
jgi:hypothetical protein